MRKLLFLNSAQRFSDLALLLMRLFVGLFLIWASGTTSPSGAHAGVRDFLRKHEFPRPRILAPVSVYLQLAIGLGFVLGLFTRWAGILCAIHFVIAIVMVDRSRAACAASFPSGCLVVIGLYLATHGAGRFSVDAALKANELPRANRRRATEEVAARWLATSRSRRVSRTSRCLRSESSGAGQRGAPRNRPGRHLFQLRRPAGSSCARSRTMRVN